MSDPQYEPRPVELSRRIDELSERMDKGFTTLNDRLDRVATKSDTEMYLKPIMVEVRSLRDDISELRNADADLNKRIESVNAELNTKIDRVSSEASGARKWGVGVALSVGTLGLGARAAGAQASAGA